MSIERLLHDATLDTDAAAMDQANQAQPRGVRRSHILVNHGRDIARLKRMQVDRVLDGNLFDPTPPLAP